LAGGMGRNQIKRLRTLHDVARTVWQSHCHGGKSEFEASFAALCRRYDAIEWDNELLQGALETEIADASNTNVQSIRAAFDAAMNHRELVIPEFVAIKAPPEADRRPLSETKASDDPVPADPEALGLDSLRGVVDSRSPPRVPLIRSSESTTRSDDAAVDRPFQDDSSKPSDLNVLRGRAQMLAARIADRNGIGDLILPLTDQGLGYVLRDVPDPSLADQLDDDALAQISTLWWQLAACAELPRLR